MAHPGPVPFSGTRAAHVSPAGITHHEPVKTVKAYKQFRTLKTKPGKLFPLFIGNQTEVPLGKWAYAEKLPTKGFAIRPGWHAGELPIGKQLRNRGGQLADDRVWAEVELPDDVDWQSHVDTLPDKELKDAVPEGGHYLFREKSQGARGTPWMIGGALRVKRVLSHEDVRAILREAGRADAIPAETRGTFQDRAKHLLLHFRDQTHVFVEAQHPRRSKGPGGGEFAPKGEGGATGGAAPQPTMHVHVHQPQPKPTGKPALTGSKGHPATISSARVTAKTSPVNSNQTYTQTGLAAMKADPETFAKAMELLKSPEMYPYFRGLKGTPDEIAEQVIAQEVQNLKFFAANAPPLTRRWGTAWYREENKAAKTKAAETGLPLPSVAGAYAALSPQNDWNMNVYQGDVVIDAVLNQQKTPWSDKMTKVADEIGRTALTKKMLDKVRGKRLEEIESPVEQAMWIRVWNEATSDRYHRLFRPDGQPGDWARTNKGVKQPATWKTLGAIANAIKSIKSGGDREIISEAMGGGNKVRSFYNNILDPESANGDITVDTHAIGAGLMDAIGGSTAPVLHGLGMTPEKDKKPAGWVAAPSPAKTGVSGLYGLHAEAYRRAAKDLGMRPLELQSLTWEAKRALFEHMPARAKQTISGIWRDYHDGKGTLEEAQRAVVKAAGGFKEPDWTRAPHDD